MIHDEGRGQRVRIAIAQRKIGKIHALAVDLGVSVAAVSRWQNGGQMSLDAAVQLSKRLDVSLDWLLLGEGALDRPQDTLLSSEEVSLIEALRQRPVAIRRALAQLVQVIPPDAATSHYREPGDPELDAAP